MRVSPCPFVLCYPSCLYVGKTKKREKRKGGQGSGCCVPPPPCFFGTGSRNISTEEQCVRLLSGSVHAYTRTESPSPYLLATCVYQMLWRASMASPSTSRVSPPSLSISYTLSCYSSPRCQNLLLFYVALLCLRLRHYPPLCISTSIAYLSSGTIRHVLTARCLSAAYPGIQQMVLISFPRNSLCPYLQCHIHFANLLNLCGGGGRVMAFFFHPQRACEITFPSSAKSTPARSSGTPMASRAVLPSSRSKIRLRLTRSWSESIF